MCGYWSVIVLAPHTLPHVSLQHWELPIIQTMSVQQWHVVVPFLFSVLHSADLQLTVVQEIAFPPHRIPSFILNTSYCLFVFSHALSCQCGFPPGYPASYHCPKTGYNKSHLCVNVCVCMVSRDGQASYPVCIPASCKVFSGEALDALAPWPGKTAY